MTSFITTCWIGIAGATGAVARYLLGLLFARRTHSGFPLGTFLINIIGAFCIGLVSGFATHSILSPTMEPILTTGFLGGFTTFSTMNWEGFVLMRGGRPRLGLFYLISSLVLGLIAGVLGLLLGRLV